MKNRIRRRLSIFLAISILLLTIMPNVFFVAHAITIGVPDGNNHPYVCLVVVDIDGEPALRGTGVLISPYIVLTAGHLTDGADGARVWFDEVVQGNPEYPYPGSTSIEGTSYTHDGYYATSDRGLAGLNWQDVGIVVLDEPVNGLCFGELPAIGVVDTLGPKTELDQIGYGVQELVHGGGPPYWVGEKVRLFAPAHLIPSQDILTDDFIKTTANPGHTPNFLPILIFLADVGARLIKDYDFNEYAPPVQDAKLYMLGEGEGTFRYTWFNYEFSWFLRTPSTPEPSKAHT